MPYTFTYISGIERPSAARSRGHSGWLLGLGSSEHLLPICLVGAVCILANAPVLLHIVSTDPVQLFSGLVSRSPHTILPGSPTIDPTGGFITLSLGHSAERSLLSGTVPWWNPLEGLGAPLLGDMQSASLFPLVFLLNGWFGFAVFHVVLEAVAGWSTYFLLRSLGVGRGTSTSGGVAFALCGTFAWLQAPPVNPVAFLPLSLLGVELCLSASQKRRRGGWMILAIGVWLSVVSGFPPTAFLDGLLVVLWAVVRVVRLRQGRGPMLAKLGLGSLVGALLSLPSLVAAFDYLPNGFLGLNNSIGRRALPTQALAQVLVPYVHGPILAFHTARGYDLMNDIWGNVGGYLDASLFSLALLGATGRRLRGLRIALAIWVALAGAETFGLPIISRFVSSLPGMVHVATFRYAAPSWEMALVVLAAMGVDDLRRKLCRPRVLIACTAVVLGLIGWSAQSAWNIDSSLAGASNPYAYTLGSALWAALAAIVVCAGGLWALRTLRHQKATGSHPRSFGVAVINVSIVLQSSLLFCFPLLSAPRPVTPDLAPVKFLQSHLGLYRFATLGPLAPNFGSYFGVAELDYNDVPIPKNFVRHVLKSLDSNLDFSLLGQQFTGSEEMLTNRPGPAGQLNENLRNYESDGVRYVVISASGVDVSGATWPSPGLRPEPQLVYQDHVLKIYELPGAAPLFADPGCQVRPADWTDVQVSCNRPSTLVYNELPMPGWTATVDGRPVIPKASGVNQVLQLPRGESSISLKFTPPYAELSLIGMLIGLTLLVSLGLGRFRYRRSQTISITPRAGSGWSFTAQAPTRRLEV